MIGYLKGIIITSVKDYVVLNVNNVGYSVITPYPFEFKLNQEIELHIYTHVREDQITLFGFKTTTEKDVFLKLIQVKGVGPKVAIGILSAVDYNQLMDAIASENITFLKKMPGIGPKSANQIILDLKGKISQVNLFSNETNDLEDAIEALIALGYKEVEVNKIAKILNKEILSTEEYIKKGLQLLLK
ncbi:Holliday junction branch migration protein RuvA [Mycoplasma sp. P36-A1]|uniref:Holliday junction branch migration protein RuvA n=1 Tax=Mycoplasma sp. P36-A1 TaxID=3252900 RepID=UPI003C2F99B0